MANLRAVLQDQEPWRLVDEDPDQHSHPLFRMSPGMKMLGALGREGIQCYQRRNERFLRNEIPYFQEIIQTTFQKVETYTNRRTEPTHGRETDGRRQTRKPGTQAEAVICPGEQDRVNPGPAPPPTVRVEGSEEPRDQSPKAEALQG